MNKKPAKLHYDKAKLEKEYEGTFTLFNKSLMVLVGLILVYFMALVVFLGGHSHTPHEPFVQQFGDRIDIEYSGLKLPIYEQK